MHSDALIARCFLLPNLCHGKHGKPCGAPCLLCAGFLSPLWVMGRVEIGEAEGLKIQVNQAMTATVSFEPAVSLPEEYHFTHYAAYGELAETAGYLEKEYEDFIGMEHPVANIYGGSYNKRTFSYTGRDEIPNASPQGFALTNSEMSCTLTPS